MQFKLNPAQPTPSSQPPQIQKSSEIAILSEKDMQIYLDGKIARHKKKKLSDDFHSKQKLTKLSFLSYFLHSSLCPFPSPHKNFQDEQTLLVSRSTAPVSTCI